MLSKCFAILALMLGGLPALAQGPAVSVSPSITAEPQMRLTGVPVPGAVQSTNWSGYAVTGSGFTEALASWIVPKVDCSKTFNGYAAQWVAIDGFPITLTQELIGTDSGCFGGEPGYDAYYDFYPFDGGEILNMTVSPGDKMSATVSYDGSQFTLSMTDRTTGVHFSKTESVLLAPRSSAEWIVEETSYPGGLPDFTRTSFGDDYTDVKNTNWAKDSTTTGPISDFGTRVQEITMVSGTGTTKAVPTALSSDGSSFKVIWKHN